jgi:hypothetical protein
VWKWATPIIHIPPLAFAEFSLASANSPQVPHGHAHRIEVPTENTMQFSGAPALAPDGGTGLPC